MIYELLDGGVVDTERDLDFNERNFIQKMLIYKYLKMDIDDFRQRWRTPGNPVWKGTSSLDAPTPAARILLDMERRLAREQASRQSGV